MSTLPDDPDALRSLLAEAVRGFDAAIAEAREQAQRRRAEERRAILAEFSETLAGQAATLRSLHDRAAAGAAEALAAEVAKDLAITAGGTEPAGFVAGEPETVFEPFVEPAPEAPAPPAPAAPAPPASIDDVKAAETGAAALLQEAGELDLFVFGGQFDAEEVEARIALLALKARAFQDEHPVFADEGSAASRTIYEAFSTMTRIAREVLAPASRYVPYLKRGYRAHWEGETARWRMRLDAVMRRRMEAAAKAEADRRRIAAEAEQARVLDLAFTELRQVIEDSASDPLWVFDLLDLVRELLPASGSIDERLLELATPHARLFATGAEFRNLRRQLKKRAEAALPSWAAPPAEPEPESPAAPATHPFEKYRGAFAGSAAAIIGASSREHRRTALRDFFGFSELEWIENERTEVADGAVVARRIENGAYRCVFLLADFSSHSLQDHVKDACKRSGVPFVLVRRGYGIVAFGRALDEAGPRAL